MDIKRIALVAAFAAASAFTVACQNTPNQTPPKNIGGPTNAPSGETTKIEPKVAKEEAGPDNSHITVRQFENGDESSIRRWDSGPIAKVVRRKHGGETKAIRVTYRDGKIVRVSDPAAIEHAMDWTAAQIDEAAKSGKVVDPGKYDTGKDKSAPAADDDDE